VQPSDVCGVRNVYVHRAGWACTVPPHHGATNLDALRERHENVIQRIGDLEETFLRIEEKKFELTIDVKARSHKLTSC